MGTSGGFDPDFQYDESKSPPGHSGKPSQVGSPGIIGRLVRRLPRILLLWLAISIPATYLVHWLIEPMYESSCTIRIEPSPDLFGPSAKGDTSEGFGQYLETQRALILSNRVLEPAMAYVTRLPRYPKSFPIVKDAADPMAEVRKRLEVNVIPGTFLIQVTFNSPSAIEAAEVVNQVVSAFEQQNKEFSVGMNGVLRTNFESYLKKLSEDIREKQDQMLALAEGIDHRASRSSEKAEKPRTEEAGVSHSQTRADELKISFVRDELASLHSMRDSVIRKLEQLNFESQKGAPRVEVVDPASASKTPQSHLRTRWMMMLSPAVLVILIGFFLVFDARYQTRRPAAKDLILP